MAAIFQVVWRWSGPVGGEGFTNLFFDATTDTSAAALDAVEKSRLLFDGVKALIPDAYNIAPDPAVRVLDDVTGDLLTIYTVTGVTAVDCTGAGVFAAPAGACIDWLTTTVHGSRRMQGRTFLVPLFGSAYDSNGSILNAYVTTIATAAEAMRTETGPAFGVWGRPRAADPDHVPPITARDGLWGPAVSSRVPDKTVILTSRRD
jgi:hypothetical protein